MNLYINIILIIGIIIKVYLMYECLGSYYRNNKIYCYRKAKIVPIPKASETNIPINIEGSEVITKNVYIVN
jgi:hypothetical protein